MSTRLISIVISLLMPLSASTMSDPFYVTMWLYTIRTPFHTKNNIHNLKFGKRNIENFIDKNRIVINVGIDNTFF